MYYIHICSCVIGHKALRAVASLLWTMMRTGRMRERERERERGKHVNVDGFMSVYSAVILIMAPDSRVCCTVRHVQAGTVSTKSRFNMQNLIQLKN